MTHPHGLTKADVAHLKAGMEVTVRIASGGSDREYTLTSTCYTISDGSLWTAGYYLRDANGEPAQYLIEVVSPKPPLPPMDEPTWLGAVVMCWAVPYVRVSNGPRPWADDEGDLCAWEDLTGTGLRPLTPSERAQYGIPDTIPDGWVCVDASDLTEDFLTTWAHWDSAKCYKSYADETLGSVARAELARRETQA